jgi:UDP-glucose 4-epimerase
LLAGPELMASNRLEQEQRGPHLSPVLARDGWAVRGAMRQASASAADVVIGSIGSETDWSTALAGVEAVAHLAARVHHPHEEYATEIYRLVNTEGTLHLARCAAKAGVRQFIFVCTVLVHGRSNDSRAPFSETKAVSKGWRPEVTLDEGLQHALSAPNL